MSLMLDNLYTEIGDAIREKKKTTDLIRAGDFADHIRGLMTKFNATVYPLVVNSIKGATITATQDDKVVTIVMGGGGPRHYGCLMGAIGL